MLQQVRSRVLIGVALVLAIACMSCGVKKADSPFDPVNLGSVAVVVSPSDLEAPWTMDGPSGLHRIGTGTTTVGSLAAGTYTVTWGSHGGWETPVPSAGELAAGGSLTLTGTYNVLAPGTININCSPAECSAPWRLEWNGGADVQTGSGSTALTGRPAGDYVITWKAVSGWYAPSPATQSFTLAPGGVATVAGLWTQMPPGSVQIDPNPDSLNAPWTLMGPAGYEMTGTGDSVVSALPGGSYSMQWGAVSGWTSPSPALDTGTLTANGLLVFSGTYVEVPPVTISVDVVPNAVTAQWTLTGPGGFLLSRAGDWSLGGLPAGQYSVTWGDAGAGWYNPSPLVLSSTVSAGGSHTFSGTYTEIPPATISVDVTPNTVVAQWTLTGPNGYTLTRAGDSTQTGLAAGQYSITWGDAGANWIMPSPLTQSFTVSAGGSHTFTGIYTEILPVTINVDVTPNSMTAQWTLTGPNDFSVTRAGDWSMPGLTAGQYSIAWGDAGSDWTGSSPSTSSHTVASGASYTFTGTYTPISKVGLFTVSSGASLASSMSWSASNLAIVYILITNPDPSGVAYWDLKVTYSGSNTVLQDTFVAGGIDNSPYNNIFLVSMPTGSPIPVNANNVAYVGSLQFYCGSRSATTVKIGPVSEIGYTPSSPMYATGSAPGTLVPLLPYNGAWTSTAFTINP